MNSTGPTFDVVVMLTSSNWFQELRSNRYHYATRFAKHAPVLFVQPDRASKGFDMEPTEIEHVSVVHVSSIYGYEQLKTLQSLIQSKGYTRPLYWVYNVNFSHFLKQQLNAQVVFHATEDYLAKHSPVAYRKGSMYHYHLHACLGRADTLIAVSDGVLQSYVEEGGFKGKHAVISNGCDFAFYDTVKTSPNSRKIAFYQGNIFGKLDYDLLLHLAQALPDWTFQFCGPVLFNEPKWQQLLTHKNVEHKGVCTPEELGGYASQATVGLIPFKQEPWLVKKSLPLKAFEYLASGLPVVSITIDALKPYQDVFAFADDAKTFEHAMVQSAALRWDEDLIAKRKAAAKAEDYDAKFEKALGTMAESNVFEYASQKKSHLLLLMVEQVRGYLKIIYKGVINSYVRYCRTFSKSSRRKARA